MNALHLVDAVSLAAAFIAMASLVIWPLFTTRTNMLLVQLVHLGGCILHYGIEGAYTAALVVSLSAVQVTASIVWGVDRRLKWVGYAMVPAIV